jgi:hypothetical protein
MHTGEVREGRPEMRGEGSTRVRVTNVAKKGIGFGSALAIAISWSQHQSILWAIIHGIFSWFYVIWYALTR